MSEENTKKNLLKDVETICKSCHRCEISKTRKNVVFSDGCEDAPIVLVGEAPGAEEDEQGVPFVGRAGQLLDKILSSQGITRQQHIYICNTLKCRPPNNRTPEKQETDNCKEYLDAQIAIIKPKIILVCGSTAMKVIPNIKDPISKVRGKWIQGFYGAKTMVIFHPSYLLRNPSKEIGSPKWLMWEDIKEIRKELDNIS